MMNLKNSIYKLSFAAMISMMAMNATEMQAQGVVPAQKGEKTFTLEDLNFGGNNYRNMVAKNRWCIRRPGGFEIRRKKRFDLLKPGDL